ncbi:MAG: hypothetical protein Q8P46_04440 [Hyphomicrobiales bacterium]|nr:hypothetical protein [Hyphomicrobiales bacterium]
MVEQAVCGEPVSGTDFPVLREFTGKFFKYVRKSALPSLITHCNHGIFSEIPYATEQGIFSGEQEICFKEQGSAGKRWGGRPPTASTCQSGGVWNHGKESVHPIAYKEIVIQ